MKKLFWKLMYNSLDNSVHITKLAATFRHQVLPTGTDLLCTRPVTLTEHRKISAMTNCINYSTRFKSRQNEIHWLMTLK